MKLVQFINQLQSSAGDKDGKMHTPATVLQYINEETAIVVKKFKEKHTVTWATTASGYYHDIDFTGNPVIKVEAIMVDGKRSKVKHWNDLRGRIGNEV